jgi:hypothetical protein
MWPTASPLPALPGPALPSLSVLLAWPALACLAADLGGILDFTGELGRVAIVQATKRDEAAVQKARDLVESIMGQFLRFDLR